MVISWIDSWLGVDDRGATESKTVHADAVIVKVFEAVRWHWPIPEPGFHLEDR